MTDAAMTQPFEAHPKLAAWIEKLANRKIEGFSLASWCAFLSEINNALIVEGSRKDGSSPPPSPSPEAVAWRWRKKGTDGPWFAGTAPIEGPGAADFYEIQPLYASPSGEWLSIEGAARDVLAERRRQVEVEGWSPDHDLQHRFGELAYAATCYAFHAAKPADAGPSGLANGERIINELWPWSREWWKPSTPRRDLVKAAALILAEIERLDRLPSPPVGEG